MIHHNPVRAYLLARWPAYYAWLGGGLVVGLIVIVAGGLYGVWWLILGMATTLLGLNYWLAASLWLARHMQDLAGMSDVVWELGGLGPDERLAAIDLGCRQLVFRLRARLRTGSISAIDVYNPQLAPGRVLARRRTQEFEQAYAYQTDPRLEALQGSLTLLPLPDNHSPAALLAQTLTELAQYGDRVLLLQEVYRILSPGGRLIVIEPVRQREGWWAWPVLRGLVSAETWHTLFHSAGFHLYQECPVNPLLYAFVWRKPALDAPQQLRFKFPAPP